MSSLWSNPLFGILLSVMAFYIGGVAARKARTPIANPLLIAMVICVLVLKILHIPGRSLLAGLYSGLRSVLRNYSA